MKRFLTVLILFCLVFSMILQGALAHNFYLIPDSDQRRLTEKELWQWDYDALGYVLNEFFARYGMPFKRDGKYYPYFTQQDWYRENPSFTYADVRSNLEWDNERLVKDVRSRMKEQGTTNPKGMSIEEAIARWGDGGDHQPYPEYSSFNGFDAGNENGWSGGTCWVLDPLPPFVLQRFSKKNVRLNVYTGPGTSYYRAGANGHAYCTTGEDIYVSGLYDGWLLVLYNVDVGGSGMRAGFVDADSFKERFDCADLYFTCWYGRITSACGLTDDPINGNRELARLSRGEEVTCMAVFQDYVYVEAHTGKGVIWGFVPKSRVRLIGSGRDGD